MWIRLRQWGANCHSGVDLCGAAGGLLRPKPAADSSIPNDRRRSDYGVTLGRFLLLSIPVVGLLSVPVPSVAVRVGETVRDLAIFDLVLAACWVVAVTNLARARGFRCREEWVAWLVVLVANVPFALSPLASYFVTQGRNLLAGVVVHLQRLGLAAVVVPLSVQSKLHRVRDWLVLSIVCSAVLLTFGRPLQAALGISLPAGWFGQRSTGAVGNPNTLGYIAILQLLMLVSLGDGCLSPHVRLLLPFGIACSLVALAEGASRSAAMSLLFAGAYLVARRPSLRLASVAVLGLTLVVGYALFVGAGQSLLWQRMTRIDFSDPNMGDVNIAARMQRQMSALAVAVRYPLGAGILNIDTVLSGGMQPVATTDNLFTDYLCTVGWFGLGSVLWLFLLMWHGTRASTLEGLAAHSLLVAVLFMSLASVGLAINFVSRLAFLGVGLGMSSGTWVGCERGTPGPASHSLERLTD